MSKVSGLVAAWGLAPALAVGLLSLAASTAAEAVRVYPIDPVPLRELCERSDLIVVARVDGLAPLATDDWNSKEASLTVLETLKGAAPSGVVRVPFPADMICPAPPVYRVGDTTLVFLAREKDAPAFFTVALDYGTKVLEPEARAVYVRRVREWVEIDRDEDAERRKAHLAEWLVQLVEHPATRWEGVFDFARGIEAAREAAAVAMPPVTSLFARLDDAQRARLVTAFASLSAMDWEWLQLLELLETVEDERLVPAVAARLAAHLDKPPSGFICIGAMKFIARRLDDASLLTEHPVIDERTSGTYIAEFLRRLALRGVPLPR